MLRYAAAFDNKFESFVIFSIQLYRLPGLETENKAVRIRRADDVTPSIRKSWH
jgi:hypothetical protein